MGKDGGSCSGNDQNAGRFTPGSRSRHLGEVSCPHSHGLQRCDCFSPWLLRPRRRPRVARHWWPGTNYLSPNCVGDFKLHEVSAPKQ